MKFSLPETRGGKSKKYFFEKLKIGEYIVAESKKKAISIFNCGKLQGFKVARRTIEGENRIYRVS